MKELNAQQLLELKKITNSKPGFSLQGKLGEFFDLYLVCEVTARKLVYYNVREKRKKLRVDSIKSAIETFVPNDLEEIPIYKIFKSGKGKRNSNTCRSLRNNYLHSLSENDRIEIEERINVLKSDMEKWINLFR